jgi:hypothetical protein
MAIAADTALFAREQLTKQIEKASFKIYPDLKIASGKIMPVVDMPGYAYENEIVITQFDTYGIATVLAASANDGGRVGVVARRISYQIKTLTAFTEIDWLSLKQAQEKGLNIDSKYGYALRRGIDKKINSIGYDGDTAFGLQGIFTSQLPRLSLATTLAAAANGDVMLSLLSNAVSTVVSNGNTLFRPKKIVMPQQQQQLLGNTMRATGSDKTVLAQFLENQRELDQIEEIVVDNTLKGKGENGTDAMLILPFENVANNGSDSDSTETYPIYFALPMDMELPTEFEQWSDTVYKERAICRTGGVIVEEPLSGAIVSNI